MKPERATALDAWATRLETEPVWSERLRDDCARFGWHPSDLVLLVGSPADFPSAARGASLVQGYFVTLGRVTDVPGALPSAYLASMAAAERRAHPGHSHALIFIAPIVEAVRFRVPEPSAR